MTAETISGETVARHSADLSRLCLSLCGNHSDADDLFQETWLKAIGKIATYDSEKPFDKWLFSVCVNAYRDTLRSPFRRRAAVFSDPDEKEKFLQSIPEREGVTDELLEVRETIASMKPRLRETVALRFFADYSEEEVAEMLKIPLGTVKSRIAKAREILRRKLK